MVDKLTIKEARLILGVDENSSLDEVKKAYRSKAMQFHPDKTNNPNHEEFVRITEAYALISNGNSETSYAGFEYKDIFNKYSNNKSKQSYFDLAQMINRIMYDPEGFYRYINDIIEQGKPKKVDNLVNILEREDYTNARRSFESDKSYALNNADVVIKTLQENISKSSFYNQKLSTNLDELKYYCTELKKDYNKSVEDVSNKVLNKAREIVLRKDYSTYMEHHPYECYIDENLRLLDKIPLDTSDIEDEFKNQLFNELNEKIVSRWYNYVNIKFALKKISLLDEYFSPEDNPNQLLIQSYEQFIQPWRGKNIPRNNRSNFYQAVKEYAVMGVKEAKKLNRIIRITHSA